MLTNIDTYNKVVNTNVNANASSTTTELELENATRVGLFVKSVSGAHLTHVVGLQLFDGTNWWDTEHIVTGEGQLHEEICIAESIRAKVTTTEGAPSLVDITIIIK